MYMRKNFNTYLFVLMLLLISFTVYSDSIVVSAFSGSGSGTPGDPYVITNVNQLQQMEDDLNAYYVLGNDVDAQETSTWNGGKGFNPVGDYSPNEFTGHFDGQGYVIRNLYINRPGERNLGLFGYIDSGVEVKNVGLCNVDITGDWWNVGGLTGYNDRGRITNCYTTGIVRGDDAAGGLVGYDLEGNVTNCFSTARVSGRMNIGGLVGETWICSYSKCYSTGSVTGTVNDAGGFVGDNDEGNITDCYSTARVTGGNSTGGFAGYNLGNINNCYSTGRVTGDQFVGGFAGENYGAINNCYWDIETSGWVTSDGGIGKTTVEMKKQATFSGWDFTTIWSIKEDVTYPYLRNMPENACARALPIPVGGEIYLVNKQTFFSPYIIMIILTMIVSVVVRRRRLLK